MDTIQKGIITLIKSAVTQQPLELPEGFSMEEAYEQIRRHSLITLAYDGAVRCGVPKSEPVMQKLFLGYVRALQISEGQMRQVDRICKAFDENGIDYMPLKGSNMKHLYPAPELRTMGDADILIRVEQYEKIRSVMERLGFVESQVQSDHELIWDHPALHLELHKRLVPSHNEDYYSYFGDGWRLGRVQQGTRYDMKPEDVLIYELTHFARHFRDGGIGCRHVTDLWLYQICYPQMDWRYLQTELDKLGLTAFYTNVRRLIDVWFAGAGSDPLTSFMTDFIFASGNWGQAESRYLSGILRRVRKTPLKSKSAGFILGSLFPSVAQLRMKYTILQKAPWLLPVVWIIRPFYKLLFERESLKHQIGTVKLINSEKVDAKRRMLRSVGLDFNF